ncbi:MAG: S-methyl-5-thioribose-1-phosphate isomerase [Gammaproteobacteria bacterium]|nr:S-methyl-5-thioribose-1-phosphate isomerase [Gammaproteobacteria bacterium]
MRVNGTPTRTIWPIDKMAVEVIDQRLLPHQYQTVRLADHAAAAAAISNMTVRGAPLIGATAAYGIALASNVDASDLALNSAAETLLATRPTAVNLRWALQRMTELLLKLPEAERSEAAWREAAALCEEDVALNFNIGKHGLELIKLAYEASGQTVNVLTHCNAGWLGTVDWGTALSPIYQAHDAGIPVHVWVDETRPRNQGASLSCWELGQHGVPHTLIPDNAGGHLMQHGQVDLVIVGCDRTTRAGDACNKIGTYLKALAANDNHVPFYVALPSPTIDWDIRDGVTEIPIEQRGVDEVLEVYGRAKNGDMLAVQIAPEDTQAVNYGFDVTPARLVTGLITERGCCEASESGLLGLFPEQAEKNSGRG